MRDVPLDIIRGASLVGIIFAHAGSDNPEVPLQHVLYLMGNSVAPIFFALVSGAALHYTRKSPYQVFVRGLVLSIFGVLLSSFSPHIIIVLTAFGIGIMACSRFLHSRPSVTIPVSVFLLVTAPFIQTLLTERWGGEIKAPQTFDVGTWGFLESALFTGTYPAWEWSGWIILGFGAYPAVKGWCAKSPVLCAVVSELCAAAAVVVSLLCGSRFPDTRYSHLINPPLISEGGWSERLTLLYGHSSSLTFAVISISAFVIALSLATPLTEKELPSLIGEWCSMSLTVYLFSSFVINHFYPGNIRIFLAVILASVLLTWVLSLRFDQDPVTKMLSRVESKFYGRKERVTQNDEETGRGVGAGGGGVTLIEEDE